MKQARFICQFRSSSILAVLASLLAIAAYPAQVRTETVLHDFCPEGQYYSCPDGAIPEARLTRHHGKLYGTTHNGGDFGNGTVFELSPNDSGGWKETILHVFTGGADGGNPLYSYVLFDRAGNLYGTTPYGGMNGFGLVFELSREDSSWIETVLYNFANGADGAYPVNGLIMDKMGNLYGTTANSGQGAFVFELSPVVGGWTERVIYGPVNDGYSGLTSDSAGNIFGVSTEDKGQNNVHINKAFELSPNGSGGWSAVVIQALEDDIDPFGTLVVDKAGSLYGTSFAGGTAGLGTVFELSAGEKGWNRNILYSFNGYPKDGANPVGGIVFDAVGNIYGTTVNGGKHSGNGTVYELVAPVEKHDYKEKVLWSFNGPDGSEPDDSLVFDNAGNLYGTTAAGGSGGNGVVFEVTP
jgi:uncharacterized repeat protein (TIGR03803 family)